MDNVTNQKSESEAQKNKIDELIEQLKSLKSDLRAYQVEPVPRIVNEYQRVYAQLPLLEQHRFEVRVEDRTATNVCGAAGIRISAMIYVRKRPNDQNLQPVPLEGHLTRKDFEEFAKYLKRHGFSQNHRYETKNGYTEHVYVFESTA